jgi:hypothetical protein
MKAKYQITPDMIIRIDNNFKYHSPINDQQDRYVAIRAKAKELAFLIAECTPPSREQSISLTGLEEAVMWANAAIARNETEEEVDEPVKSKEG